MPRPRRLGTGPRRTMADAVEAAVATEDRSRHHLGMTELADLLGRDRGTIASWIEKKCPTVWTGAPGERTLLDPADVLRWREQFVRDEEARKYARPEGADPELGEIPLKPADLLKLEQLKLTRLKVGQAAEILVVAAIPEAAWERAYAILRQTMMAIPERITRDMAGFPEDRKLKWRENAQGYVRAGLRQAAKAVADAMRTMPLDPDDEA